MNILGILSQNGASAAAGRGVFMGGATGLAASTAVTTIDYISIPTTGNATTFGNLATAVWRSSGCSSSTRGVSGAGNNTGGTNQSALEYITIASTGNGTSFGNLTTARRGPGALASSTRGVWAGGFIAADSAVIDYITIASTGNATSFGSLTQAVFDFGAGAGSSTRGIYSAGVYNGGGNYYNSMQYITIASVGNSTVFGTLSSSYAGVGSGSSSTRFISFGGNNVGGVDQTNMEYVTIATTGNATNFGSLTVARTYPLSGASNSTRLVAGGGFRSDTWASYTTLDYVTIATTGNATSFGALSQARGGGQVAVSDSHGGL